MSKYLHLMCGIPGSGKSTWIAQNMGPNDICISRDEIRKSMVGEDVNDANYFRYETQVFAEFVRQINMALAFNYEHIYVDATHINRAGRRKVLRELLTIVDTTLVIEVFHTPIEVCLARNALRTGFANVPESAIHSMATAFSAPTKDEFKHTKYGFAKVIINEHGA